ncbi:MAG: SEL1-like repeat protein [Desulfomicrobium sp.]|nr:SEL1-like repeat protein [Pseudomonadota bacterium]MBV1713498.1 SEL1-like repeat protein [Desulfomicrobium sp.]MBU4572034.1 SEL1-like repeat protein [Pseudomonadota bacterium]MBU4594012.1 SEL1-like repeat protein [Pseudomonadota bacterium]MBV1721037.1 SEL1-like repeat protein [Desulfomicrobium sp.]
MKRWLTIALFFLLLPFPALASEPAYDTLPPELVRLRDEGQLTVRALWAWKLVPESTAGMAMEFRALGLDLISADRAQLASWLRQADEGQLGLSETQRDVIGQLISRMDEGLPSGEQHVSDVSVVQQSPAVGVDGTGKVEDLGEMIRVLGAQAEGGDPKAKVSLALAVRTGAGGSPDPIRSVALLEEAAGAGDADAMALLADEYESGLWVPQDLEKAVQLRLKAAEAGSQLAQWGLK